MIAEPLRARQSAAIRLLFFGLIFLVGSLPVRGSTVMPEEGTRFKTLPLGQELNSISWKVLGETFFHPINVSQQTVFKGKNVLAYLPKGKLSQDFQKTLKLPETGDLEVALDFMLSPDGSFMLTVGDDFKVKLLTSKKKGEVSGAISTVSFNYPPYTDVAKAPGLWQNLRWVQRYTGARKSGRKLESVYLNGVLIHQGIEIMTTSVGIVPTSLMIAGESKAFSVRNIRYRKLDDELEVDQRKTRNVVGDIILSVTDEPVLLRSFIMHGGVKKTHVLSIGYTEGVSMTYNLAKGAPLWLWKGQFLRTNNMWDQRGLNQIAEPMGSLLLLPDKPSLSRLTHKEMIWPDSATTHADYHYHGYSLDDIGKPEFLYQLDDIPVVETFNPLPGGYVLERKFIVNRAMPNWWCRAAIGTVRKVGKGLYSINDYQYLIGSEEEVLIRNMGDQDELLIPFKGKSLSYTIIY